MFSRHEDNTLRQRWGKTHISQLQLQSEWRISAVFNIHQAKQQNVLDTLLSPTLILWITPVLSDHNSPTVAAEGRESVGTPLSF